MSDDHWLVFNDAREVTGCHCGFRAQPDDCGWGDSVVAHLRSLPAEQQQDPEVAAVES